MLQSKKKKRRFGLGRSEETIKKTQYNAVLTLAAVLPSSEKCKRLDELK